ncbi:hypothetical protein [Phaeodactylibacter xiamenensis]|uniref:hypothetical protein n=1 Tax=Phaeodactylibacter xiamenensis TaxID=1524460 RepID=UPI0024A92753|nr:hypothetical protein [Phaeodactylibacter xiamenensis]
MDTTEIVKLREVMEQNVKAMDRYAEVFDRLFQKMQQQASPWCSPEEAADLLGIQKTKSGNHRRRLSRAVERGLIKKVRSGKEPRYWREEMRALATKLAQDEIVI